MCLIFWYLSDDFSGYDDENPVEPQPAQTISQKDVRGTRRDSGFDGKVSRLD